MSDTADDRARAAWRRASELFHQALALSDTERSALLARAELSDPDLAREVRSLLEAHGREDAFIAEPAASQSDLDAIARAMPVSGRRVGPYELRRVLGEGGMGVVYLAEDRRLSRIVALKAVRPIFAGDDRRAQRLRHEARAAAALAHPAIAIVYALEEIDGQFYIASEYVPGRTLRDVLPGRPLDSDEAARIARQLLEGLAAAHEAGIVHGDLKPENVIRTAQGTIKILDFGLARVRDPLTGDSASTLVTHDGAGTPAYMAPEQIRGERIDARTDLFALGVMLFEAVTGVHPFEGGSPTGTVARIIEAEPAATTTVLDARGGRLLDIARTLLRKSPAERFQTAREVTAVIDAIGEPSIRDPRGEVPPVSSTPRSVGQVRWWWVFHEVAAAFVYVLLLLPLWHARSAFGADWGQALFLTALIGAIVAGTLRLHLCFAARHYPTDWRRQHARSRGWAVGADLVFAVVLLVVGIAAVRGDAGSGVLLVASAAAVTVATLIIEPATTRAAFNQEAE